MNKEGERTVGLVWNPLGIAGTVAFVLAWTLAAVVYTAAPRRSQNRRLALVLAVEGATFATGAGWLYLMDSPFGALGMQGIFVTGILAMPWIYLLFIATLDTPLVRPLKTRVAGSVIVVALVAVEAYWLVRSELFMPAVVTPWYARHEVVLGDPIVLGFEVMGLASIYALVATIDAYRRAGSDVARKRARAFALAFGTRDVVFGLALFVWPLFLPVPPEGGGLSDVVFIQVFPVTSAIFTLLVGYGILTAQLFDIDVKIKFAVRQSTVAGAFVAVFFVVSEVAQQAFSSRVGSVLGVVAAGLLLFALAPIQRAAERVANAAMPKVDGSPEYLRFKKMEVYRAAAEGVYRDGTVSADERAILDDLRERLGLGTDVGRALESEISTRRAATA